MSLYEDWMKKAFSQEGRSIEAVWEEYHDFSLRSFR